MKLYQRTIACLAALVAVHCSPRYFVIPRDVNKDKHIDLIIGEEHGDVYVLFNSKENKDDSQRVNIRVYLGEGLRDLPVREEGYIRKNLGSLLHGVEKMGVYDINGDGLEDVIAVDKKRGVYLFFNEGDGNFRVEKTISAQ